MRLRLAFLPALLAVIVLAAAASTYSSGAYQDKGKKEKAGKTASLKDVKAAMAVITPTKGSKVQGMVMFMQMGNKVKVVADIEGLTPGQKHGFHIHEFGYCGSEDGLCTGGHYDPAGTGHHALPGGDKAHHAGDMGNLEADKDGKAHYEATFDTFTLTGKNPILGRGVVVHAKPDDGGQPTGNAGGRSGVGTIGVAKPDAK